MNEVANFDLNDKKIELIKRMYCKGASNDEFEVFLAICKRTRLDPLMKQIYMIERSTKNDKTEKWEKTYSVQASIDGFRLIAERSGKYSPGREPTYLYDENKSLVAATAYVKKLTEDGTWHEIGATAHWNEYVQTKKDGTPTKFWNKMKHVMLAKCAEALALRKAFPADLCGLYTDDEMAQSDNAVIDIPPEAKPQKKESRNEGINEIGFDDASGNFEEAEVVDESKVITKKEWVEFEAMHKRIDDPVYFKNLKDFLQIDDFKKINKVQYNNIMDSFKRKLEGKNGSASAVA